MTILGGFFIFPLELEHFLKFIESMFRTIVLSRRFLYNENLFS